MTELKADCPSIDEGLRRIKSGWRLSWREHPYPYCAWRTSDPSNLYLFTTRALVLAFYLENVK